MEVRGRACCSISSAFLLAAWMLLAWHTTTLVLMQLPLNSLASFDETSGRAGHS